MRRVIIDYATAFEVSQHYALALVAYRHILGTQFADELHINDQTLPAN
jgi:hypothetical protein